MKKNKESKETLSEDGAKGRTTVACVGWATIVVNLLLALGKLLAGIFGHSMAMISDAVHSASDVFSTFIVMIGAKLGGNRADKDHNYGHERFESVAAILLGMVLFTTGAALIVGGIQSIIAASADPETFVKPALAAIIAAGVSIAVKEAMYWYTIHYAKLLRSAGLKADAWHHRSDALSSVGSLIGIGGAMLGVYVLDGVATVIIALLIMRVAIKIALDVLKQLTDHAAPDETVGRIYKLIIEERGVENVDDLKTRLAGNVVYVEAEIAVRGDLPLVEAHEVAERIHDRIEREIPEVKHVTVHVNPWREEAP